MANEFARNIQDAALQLTKALPAAGASNQSDALDLGAVGGIKPECVEVEIQVPAIAAHVTTSSDITLKLQDSADNSSFADVDAIHQTVIPGVAVTGSVAKNARFRLPSQTRRYVRFNQACGATDNNTGSSIVYKFLF